MIKPFLKQLAAQLSRELNQALDILRVWIYRGFGLSVGVCLFLSMAERFAK